MTKQTRAHGGSGDNRFKTHANNEGMVMNKRSFCKAGVVAGAGLGFAPRFSIGNPGVPPNDKVNLAFVGIGGVGQFGLKASLKENIVAVCDVDWRDAPGGREERAAAKHAQLVPNAERFTDFRKMLDKLGSKIDAVAIATPDHTHFAIAMEAMQRGKHVFLQKPMAHNITQVRTLKKAAEHYGVKTMMGNQGHCFEGTRRIVEWVRRGVLGDVGEIHCWTDRPRLPWFPGFKTIPPAGSPVPEGVDWDLWQGPVEACEYSDEYMPMKWRGWWKYGCGGLGDIGCHVMDAPMWALDLDYPEKIEVVETEGWKNTQYTPTSSHLVYHFPAKGNRKAVEMHWYEGKFRPQKLEGMTEMPTNGMIMKGSKETLYHEDMRAESPRLWPYERLYEYKSVLKEKTLSRSPTGNPYTDLWESIRGNEDACASDFNYASTLTETVLLGAMAIRANETITWDPVKMQCSSTVAQQWVDEPARKGWGYAL